MITSLQLLMALAAASPAPVQPSRSLTDAVRVAAVETGTAVGRTAPFATPARVLMPSKTWNGSVSTDWANGSNWTGGAPASGDDVTIPLNLTNYPVISANSTVHNITLT